MSQGIEPNPSPSAITPLGQRTLWVVTASLHTDNVWERRMFRLVFAEEVPSHPFSQKTSTSAWKLNCLHTSQ